MQETVTSQRRRKKKETEEEEETEVEREERREKVLSPQREKKGRGTREVTPILKWIMTTRWLEEVFLTIRGSTAIAVKLWKGKTQRKKEFLWWMKSMRRRWRKKKSLTLG